MREPRQRAVQWQGAIHGIGIETSSGALLEVRAVRRHGDGARLAEGGGDDARGGGTSLCVAVFFMSLCFDGYTTVSLSYFPFPSRVGRPA